MHRNTILYVLFAALAGFVAGFFLANSLNRTQNSGIQISAEPASSGVNTQSRELDLGSDEIRDKLAEADRSPSNFAFQKNLGTALYRYAAVKQDPQLMSEAARILQRAFSLNTSDFDVIVALGNAEFDLGFYKNEKARFEAAREKYKRALELKPADLDVSTDLGISYFVQEPADLPKAEAQLRKVLATDPKHERALQFLVKVLGSTGREAEAREELKRLQSIAPANPAYKNMEQDIKPAAAEAR